MDHPRGQTKWPCRPDVLEYLKVILVLTLSTVHGQPAGGINTLRFGSCPRETQSRASNWSRTTSWRHTQADVVVLPTANAQDRSDTVTRKRPVSGTEDGQILNRFQGQKTGRF